MQRPRIEELARTAPDARARLVRLQAERLEARLGGVDPTCAYVHHLEAAIAEARADYVTSAVVELAGLHGRLDGPRLG
ncbi:MAG: hypothetical protein HZB46_03055 [Solirubrobacterales bacterium]|nr:hypothetical protein [Solirubrobacterales bacterium]